MSTQSNAVNDAAPVSQAAAPAVISPLRSFYWCVRREVWEYRSIYIAPAVAAALVIVALLIAVGHGAVSFRITTMDGALHKEQANAMYDIAMSAIMGVSLVVAVFYCLSTLHSERQDRSVLFWKSLPVSDLTTVLSKVAVAAGVIPAVMMALIMATHVVILLIESVVVAVSGQGMAAVWPTPGLLPMWGLTICHIVVIHVLWYAPIYCYLLMISALARRAPFLWAVLPPVIAGIVEKIAFGSSNIFLLLLDRLSGQSFGATGSMEAASMNGVSPLRFLSSSGLWLGLLFAVVCLMVAVRLRRAKSVI